MRFGGSPYWIQDPVYPIGPIGEVFKLLLQISDGYAFPKQNDAPEQPDCFSSENYCLFLGNEVFVFVA